MKVEVEKHFQPVTIMLENQEEVDALFGILNHTDANKTHTSLNNLFESLQNLFVEKKYFHLFEKNLKKRYCTP